MGRKTAHAAGIASAQTDTAVVEAFGNAMIAEHEVKYCKMFRNISDTELAVSVPIRHRTLRSVWWRVSVM